MNRFLLKIKTLLVILIFPVSAQMGLSQALLVENFEYANGALLTSNNWSAHSGAGTQAIDVVVPGLIFNGYPSSDIGGAAQIDNNGEDVNKAFTAQESGTVYTAFMLRVNALPATDGYFLNLGGNPIGTTFRSKLFTVGASSPFNFGASVGSNTATPVTGGSYTTGTTYLCILKYEVVAGTNNDAVSLFIFPDAIPSTEPGTPTLGPLTDASQTDINPGSIALRQFNASQNILVDGIRIGTTWADVTSDVAAPVATIVPADAATDVAINVVPTITFDEAVRNTDASEITDANLSSIVKFKKTNSTGEDVPCTMTIDAAKKVITITSTTALDNSQAYYIECGEVEDAYGNTGVVKSSTFTTIGAATPAIALTAPVGGETFYAGQAVSITWTSANITNVMVEAYVPTADVYNWITLSPGVVATEGKLDYTIPADADYGTGYKIRVSDASAATVNSESAVFTVIGVATSLTDLRERFVSGDVVRLSSEATVTFIRPANRNQKYIQDAGAGLLIDDVVPVITTTIAIGDNIKNLEGKLGLYGGALQIVPTVTTVTVVSSGNTVTIPELTIPEYNTDYLKYESMLVKFKNVSFVPIEGTTIFAAGANYTVTDGTNTVVFRSFKSGDGDIVGSVIPTYHFNGVFIAGFYNATIQVFGRNMSDFTALSSLKAITAFAFNGLTPAVVGTVDETAKTVTVSVPIGTVVTALVPTITISDKATIAPLSGVANDFTNAVTYTVTAEDGTTQAYVVTVTILTGVDKNAEAVIVLGPVPAKNTLNINNIETVKLIEIFNVAGVKIETVRCEGITSLPLSVEKYKSGYYFIRFTTSDGVFMKRFIKQ